jgi:hypothetical protein
MVNRPSTSVDVPVPEPETFTDAPGSGSFFIDKTLPDIFPDCAKLIKEINNADPRLTSLFLT